MVQFANIQILIFGKKSLNVPTVKLYSIFNFLTSMFWDFVNPFQTNFTFIFLSDRAKSNKGKSITGDPGDSSYENYKRQLTKIA